METHVVLMFVAMVTSVRATFVPHVTGTQPVVQCTGTWFRGDCYTFYSDSSTWEEAKQVCETQLGHLAVIRDTTQFNFIKILAEFNGEVGDMWINGQWSGDYVFTDGTAYDFDPEGSDPDGYTNHLAGSSVTGALYYSAKPYICKRAGACTTVGKTFRGSCYALMETSNQRFYPAEEACQAGGGNLASYHSQQEFNLLKELSVGVPAVWIGLTRRFENTDGSTFSYYAATHQIQDECLTLETDKIAAQKCDDEPFPFMCVRSYYLVGMSEEVTADLVALFDDTEETCVDRNSLLTSTSLYRGGFRITKLNSNMDRENIGLRIRYDQLVTCQEEKPFYTRNSSPNCDYLQSCPLAKKTSTTSYDCVYTCPCDVTGCDVIYTERDDVTPGVGSPEACHVSVDESIR